MTLPFLVTEEEDRKLFSESIWFDLGLTNLENEDVRVSVRSLSAAVDRDVFEPLDVRLRVAEHSTHKRHVAANDRRLVSRQTGLQDGPVRRALWKTKFNELVSQKAAAAKL